VGREVEEGFVGGFEAASWAFGRDAGADRIAGTCLQGSREVDQGGPS
jgi:hypothetical protein